MPRSAGPPAGPPRMGMPWRRRRCRTGVRAVDPPRPPPRRPCGHGRRARCLVVLGYRRWHKGGKSGGHGRRARRFVVHPARAPSRWVRCRRKILFSRAGGLRRRRLDAVRREPLDDLPHSPPWPRAGIAPMPLSVCLIARGACAAGLADPVPAASAAEGSLEQLVQGHAPHMPSTQPAPPAPLRRPVLADIVGREREPPGGEMPPGPPERAAVRHDPPSCGGGGGGGAREGSEGREACTRAEMCPLQSDASAPWSAALCCPPALVVPTLSTSREPEQLHRGRPIPRRLPRWTT